MNIYFPEFSSDFLLSFKFSDIILPDFLENFFLDNKENKEELEKKNIIEILFFCRDFLQKKQNYLLHTSGSTGMPKPININYTQICESIKMTQKALNITHEDVFCVCLPTQFIAGKMMLARALYLGCEMWIYMPSTKFLDNVKHKFTFIALVPPQLQHILSQENQTKILDTCKNIIVGGAPVSVFLRNEIVNKLKNAKIFLTYGMTETVSHIALQKLNFLEKENQEIFYTLENVEIAQYQEDSLQKGCLKIKSPTTNNEWIITNDSVEIISPNQFRLLGRVDNIINIGGKKMQLEEIELKYEHFFIENRLENLVFYAKTIQNDTWGESIVLVFSWENIDECKKIFFRLFPIFNVQEKIQNSFTKEDMLFNEMIKIFGKGIEKEFLPQIIEIKTKFEKTVTMKIKKR